MKKCTICQGQKAVYGMGNMREKCKNCDGKGFHEEPAPIKVTAEHIEKKKKDDKHVRST